MRIPILLQARMSSTRLPNKVLADVQDKFLLEYTLERLRQSKYFKDIVMLISWAHSDDILEQFCLNEDIPYFRGPLHNVAERYYLYLLDHPCEAFMRICADSPLIDPQVIDDGYEVYRGGKYDIVTNTLDRSFPKGISFQIFNTGTYLEYFPQFYGPETEHVGQYFYSRAERFQIANLRSEDVGNAVKSLAIDTPEDLERFKEIIAAEGQDVMSKGWEELVEIQERVKV